MDANLLIHKAYTHMYMKMSNVHNINAYLQTIDTLIDNINNLDNINKINLMQVLDKIDNKINEFDTICNTLPKLHRNEISEFP